MSQKKPDDYIDVDLDIEALNLPISEAATYRKIQKYIFDKYNVKIHTDYIAEVKRKCGLEMRKCYNKKEEKITTIQRAGMS